MNTNDTLNRLRDEIRAQKAMDTKYTTDGKKVAVTGKLNSTEWIVQEIYVTENGSEIPSGENFTVRSLHDEPVVPWAKKFESEFRRLEEQHKKDGDRLRKEILEQERKLRAEYNKLYVMTKDLQSLVSHLKNPESRLEFIRFLDFLSGKIEWVVIDEKYDVPEIVKFENLKLCNSWNGRYDGIKLITLFGESNGRLDYQLGQYRDSSGSSYEIHPFVTYGDAFEKFKELLIAKNITEQVINTAKEYGIELDNVKLIKYYRCEEKNLSDSLAALDNTRANTLIKFKEAGDRIKQICKNHEND